MLKKGYLFDLITEELLNAIDYISTLTNTIVYEGFTTDGYYEVTIKTDLKNIKTVENCLAPLV